MRVLKTDRSPDILREMEETFSVSGFDIPVRLINLTGGGPETFEALTRHHVDVLQKYVGLDPSHSILEIGCGIGRDAIPFLQILGPSGRYWGIDIIKDSIDWCQANIAARNPRFQFIHYNVKDQLHNPGGDTKTTGIHLPIEDGSVDTIFLWSVFTHMFERDIVHYLREFRRVLKKHGRVYATWFVVNDAVLESARRAKLTPWDLRFEHVVSPGCYIIDPLHPASAVAFDEHNIRAMLKQAGLELVGEFLRGTWSGYWPNPHGGQDATVLALPSESQPAVGFKSRNLAKRCIYRARRSPTLRRVASLPVFSSVTNAISRRVLPPPGGYRQWIAERLLIREDLYSKRGEKGLLSFLTTVWNTPVQYLKEAAESLLRQQTVGDFEWVVLDNGSSDVGTQQYLRDHVAPDPRVKFSRIEQNAGIIGGMRRVLEHAGGRYVVPFDSDDRLQPDTVAILTDSIRQKGYPAALYSDEDKLDARNQPCTPYFKPDWDPVLFLNSCYIAHLGCFDREKALELSVYTDDACEGSHDWDTFLRFMLAGHQPMHIAEMLYSWRMHQNSTAGNIRAKDFIYQSHRSVLGRFLGTRPGCNRYELKLSPLFNGTPDWWYFRKPVEPAPLLTLMLTLDPQQANPDRHAASCEYPDHKIEIIHARQHPREVLPLLADRSGLICVMFDAVQITHPQWAWDALAITELHPDTAVIASRLVNQSNWIIDASRQLGFAGLFGCPDRGLHVNDPGFAGQMWKQRSAGGASSHLCVFDAAFLRQVLTEHRDVPISWFFLGAWAAVSAIKAGRRIVYSPFLTGTTDFDVDAGVGQPEMDLFRQLNGKYLADSRYYSPHLDLRAGHAYEPAPEGART